MIDIAMTATRRPEIIRRTLESFERLMFPNFLDCRLVINIDPVGPGSLEDVRGVVREFFGVRALILTTDWPSFPRAWRRVWRWTESEFVFHLEDDWELLERVDVVKMYATMKRIPELASLRLNDKPANETELKTWNKFIPWCDDGFFEVPENQRLSIGPCGHPALWRGDLVRAIAKKLDPEKNPEKQLHAGAPEITDKVRAHRWGVWARPGEPAKIRDIGRHWMVESGWEKDQRLVNKANFTQWRKVD